MSYTREDEDGGPFGLPVLLPGRLGAERFADFFRKMISMGMDTQSAATSDHPTLKSRVEKTDQRDEEPSPPESKSWRQQPVATPSELRQYQQRAAATTMPNDQQLQQSKELPAALPRSCLTPARPALPGRTGLAVSLIKQLQAMRNARQGQAQTPKRQRHPETTGVPPFKWHGRACPWRRYPAASAGTPAET